MTVSFERDLVFVSYAHRDAWALERLRVLLKGSERRGQRLLLAAGEGQRLATENRPLDLFRSVRQCFALRQKKQSPDSRGGTLAICLPSMSS
jgi:hypothetical protein